MPGMGKLDNALRWGFIKKVYGIMSTQLALTALVAAGSAYLLFNCVLRRRTLLPASCSR